jgi:hypothetical protein
MVEVAAIGGSVMAGTLFGWSMAHEQFIGNFKEYFLFAKTNTKEAFILKYGVSCESIFDIVNSSTNSNNANYNRIKINPLDVIKQVFLNKDSDSGIFNSVTNFIQENISKVYKRNDNLNNLKGLLKNLLSEKEKTLLDLELFNLEAFKIFFTKTNKNVEEQKIINYILANISNIIQVKEIINNRLTPTDKITLIDSLFNSETKLELYPNIGSLFIQFLNTNYNLSLTEYKTEAIKNAINKFILHKEQAEINKFTESFRNMNIIDFKNNKNPIKDVFSKKFIVLLREKVPLDSATNIEDFESYIDALKSEITLIETKNIDTIRTLEALHLNKINAITNNDETILIKELKNFLKEESNLFTNFEPDLLSIDSFNNILIRNEILKLVYEKVFSGAKIVRLNDTNYKTLSNKKFLNFLFYCIKQIQMNKLQIN